MQRCHADLMEHSHTPRLSTAVNMPVIFTCDSHKCRSLLSVQVLQHAHAGPLCADGRS